MRRLVLFFLGCATLVVFSQNPQRFPGGVISSKFIVTGSSNDSVLLGSGGRRAVSTIVTDTTHLSARINTKQPSGTYATGTGTAYGSNNGDETISSIKTKIGAATSSNDGYLKYQDWITFNAKQNVIPTGTISQYFRGDFSLATFPTSLPASDVYAWAKASTKPSYAYSEITGTPTLFSGSYTDLTNKPTIPAAQVQSDWNAVSGLGVILNKPTQLSQFTNNLGNYGNFLTGITSGQVTTALGYTPKPTFTENTAFNKNFGTTTGTVLEGRTFGTAAGSSVGDFIQSQNNSAQSANMWISGDVKGNQLQSTVATGTAPLTVNSTTMVSNLNAQYLGSNDNRNTVDTPNTYTFPMLTTEFKSNPASGLYDGGGYNGVITYRKYGSDGDWSGGLAYQLGFTDNGNIWLRSGMSTGWSTWNKLYHSGNLTTTLSTNYIPKWNGSNFVNSLISDDGEYVKINGNRIYKSNPTSLVLLSGGSDGLYINNKNNTANIINFGENGNIYCYATTASTSLTTGALVVAGGIGADHVRANNLYGNGSNLTGVQKPITLTTTGTSGAATFDGTTLNVPNYAISGNYILNQSTPTQTADINVSGTIHTNTSVTSGDMTTGTLNASNTIYASAGISIPYVGNFINGSVSGTAYINQPYYGGGEKKVIIRLAGFSGSASYTFTSAFTYTPVALNTNGPSTSIITSLSNTGFTLNSGSSVTGFLILEGY